MVFFFALAGERIFIKTFSIESRCVIGPENILFAGVIGPENILFAGESLDLSARKSYKLGQ